MIKAITYKPLFWLSFITISLGCIIFSYVYFPKTFDIVHVDITVNRQEVLKIAQELHKKYNWHPEQYAQAASFDVNKLAKTYIELKAGGVEQFSKILEEKFYYPYTWAVRQFHEFDIHESTILLTPKGEPYGFYVTIPEDASGAALAEEEALKIAQATISDWHIDINKFILVEKSQETMPSGRIDHSFTYEGKEKIADAPYRLTVIIKGDQPARLHLTLQVPEAFERSYSNMRSYNNTLALIATLFMIIFYFFGGALGGLFFLYKKKALSWHTSLLWALLIAVLQLLGRINEMPLSWIQYNTSISHYTFMTNLFIQFFYTFCFYLAIGYPIILAAEGLTRLAFGHHIQLWKTWSSAGAHSIQVLGRTIAAYLMVGIDMAYVIIFYFFTLNYLGWWSPAEALYDPNILASYFPWLTPIEKSLAAGFLEECFFRAIPLAGAAIIGQRFGKKRLFIIITYIIQALVFGAAHANYPAQPFFARMVELIIPSFIFGFTYLRFGLLSAIITHFLFDVVWFAMPIFVSNELHFAKMLVIVLSTIPLLVIAHARLKNRRWILLPNLLYNYAWKPQPDTGEKNYRTVAQPVVYTKWSLKTLSLFALCAVVLWIALAPFKVPVPALTITKKEAIDQARTLFGTHLAHGSWHTLAGFRDPWTLPIDHANIRELTFAWRHINDTKNKKIIFYNLVKNSMLPPHWQIRFTKASNNVAERAEEYRARIGTDGKVLQQEHILPQDFSMPLIEKEAAHNLVKEHVLTLYPERFSLVSAIEEKHPNRKDWQFTFSTITPELSQGQKRIKAIVAGNEITNSYPFIFMPEQWKRAFTQEVTLNETLTLIQTFLLILGFLLTCGFYFRVSRHKHFSLKTALFFAVIFIVRAILQTINQWPQYASRFVTKTPYLHQAFGIISAVAMQNIAEIILYCTLIGILYSMRPCSPQLYQTNKSRFLLGIGLGMSTACIIYGLVLGFGYNLYPLWPDLTPAGGTVPIISECLYYLMNFARNTIILTTLVGMLDVCALYDRYHINKIILTLIIFGSLPIITPIHWVLSSIIGTLIVIVLYRYLLPSALTVLPFACATYFALQSLQHGTFALYPSAFISGIISCIVIFLCGWYWSNSLEENDYPM